MDAKIPVKDLRMIIRESLLLEYSDEVRAIWGYGSQVSNALNSIIDAIDSDRKSTREKNKLTQTVAHAVGRNSSEIPASVIKRIVNSSFLMSKQATRDHIVQSMLSGRLSMGSDTFSKILDFPEIDARGNDASLRIIFQKQLRSKIISRQVFRKILNISQNFRHDILNSFLTGVFLNSKSNKPRLRIIKNSKALQDEAEIFGINHEDPEIRKIYAKHVTSKIAQNDFAEDESEDVRAALLGNSKLYRSAATSILKSNPDLVGMAFLNHQFLGSASFIKKVLTSQNFRNKIGLGGAEPSRIILAATSGGLHTWKRNKKHVKDISQSFFKSYSENFDNEAFDVYIRAVPESIIIALDMGIKINADVINEIFVDIVDNVGDDDIVDSLINLPEIEDESIRDAIWSSGDISFLEKVIDREKPIGENLINSIWETIDDYSDYSDRELSNFLNKWALKTTNKEVILKILEMSQLSGEGTPYYVNNNPYMKFKIPQNVVKELQEKYPNDVDINGLISTIPSISESTASVSLEALSKSGQDIGEILEKSASQTINRIIDLGESESNTVVFFNTFMRYVKLSNGNSSIIDNFANNMSRMLIYFSWIPSKKQKKILDFLEVVYEKTSNKDARFQIGNLLKGRNIKYAALPPTDRAIYRKKKMLGKIKALSDTFNKLEANIETLSSKESVHPNQLKQMGISFPQKLVDSLRDEVSGRILTNTLQDLISQFKDNPRLVLSNIFKEIPFSTHVTQDVTSMQSFNIQTNAITLSLTKELAAEIQAMPKSERDAIISIIKEVQDHVESDVLSFAWARFHTLGKDVIFITEVQTDIPYHLEQMISGWNPNPVGEKIKPYLFKLLDTWERSLIIALKHYAEKHGFKILMIWDGKSKQKLAGLRNSGKIQRIYEDIPKSLGFQKKKIRHKQIKVLMKSVGIKPDTPIWYAKLDQILESKNSSQALRQTVREILKESVSDDQAIAALDLVSSVVKQSDEFKGKVFLAGGAVRDQVMGKTPKDLDVVVAMPEGGIKFANYLAETLGIKRSSNPVLFPAFGTARVDLKGLSHNGIDLSGMDVESVMTRGEEYEPGSRKPKVVHASLKDDVMRRDLTINSLLRDLTSGEILDLTGKGMKDIEDRVIRTPADPDITLQDDPLRILRAFRFAGRYGYDLDSELRASLEKNVDALSTISRERVREEFEKILSGANPDEGMSLLFELGADKYIFPSSRPDRNLAVDVAKKGLGVLPSLALILHRSSLGSVGADLRELRLSTKDIRVVVALVKAVQDLLKDSSDTSILKSGAALDKVDAIDHANEVLDLAIPGISSKIQKLSSHFGQQPKVFISGDRLQSEFGVRPGPELGQLIKLQQEIWFQRPEVTEEEILDVLRDKRHLNEASKKEKSGGTATVKTQYSQDLSLALQWGRSLGLMSGGSPKKIGNGYSATVNLKSSKSKLRWELKNRFGTFVSVS